MRRRKGAGPAAAAAVARQVDFATVDSASAIPYVKGGKLRALAVTTAKRSELFKDIPTVAEAAVPAPSGSLPRPARRARSC